MTADEFQAARKDLGLTAQELADILNVDLSTVQKWETATGTTKRKPNPVAVKVVQWMQQRGRPKEWPKGSK